MQNGEPRAHLGQDRKDGREISAGRDELQGDKVFHNGLVVSVDEMTDGLDHAILDVLVHAGHETKVQDCQLAIRRPLQVAGMRMCSTHMTVSTSGAWS